MKPLHKIFETVQKLTRVGKSYPSVWFLVAVSFSLNLYGIDWGLPNGDQDWANDSLAPVEPLAYAKRMLHQESWKSKYPPLHYMILAVFYAPYALYLYLSGGITSPTDFYPYGLKDPQSSLMVFTLIARATSAVMGTGTVLVNYLTVKLLYGHVAGLICGFLLATSYPIIYYSHNANVDVPQLFWISLALYSFVCLLKTYETRYYLLLGLFSALAIGTKNSSYALVGGLALPLLWFHIRHEEAVNPNSWRLSALFHRKLLLGLCTFAITLILVFNLPFNWQGFMNHVQFHLKRSVRKTGVIGELDSIVQRDLMLFPTYLFYLIDANGFPVFLLLAAGFFYCLVKFPERSWPFIIPIVTYYFFYLRATPWNNLRNVLPVYLLLTWQAGKFAADLLDYRKIPKFVTATAMFLLLAHSFLYGFSVDLLFLRDSRYAAEQWMEKNIPKHAVIAALKPEYSLPRFPATAKIRHVRPTPKDNIIGNLGLEGDDYLVIDMGLDKRTKQRHKIYQLLLEKGFSPVGSFKSEIPLFGADIFHTVNPEIVIFKANRQPVQPSTPGVS